MSLDGTTPDWLHLSEDEDVVWTSRPHPAAMGVGLPVGVLLVLVGFLIAGLGTTDGGVDVLTAVGVLLVALGSVAILAQYVVWASTRYVITSSELYAKRGVVSRDVTRFRLERVRSTSLHQSGVGRVFGYGDLTIHPAGDDGAEVTFERLPRPQRAASALATQLENVPGPGTRPTPS